MASARSAGRKLAIVGFWDGNRQLAPFQDPTYEIWSLNHLHPYIPRWDVWFDMHKPEWSAQNMKPEVWKDQDGWLRKEHGKPVYMLEKFAEYPSSVAYPIDAVKARFKPYFTNGIAYMLALALFQHAENPISRIELWGVDMRHEEEYAIQRPCTEWWLGLATGMGIEVFIPPQAVLTTSDHLYGYEERGGIAQQAIRQHKIVIEKCLKEQETHIQMAQALDGMIQDNREWVRRWEQYARGGGIL